MSFTTKGQGAGEVLIDLESLGVPPELYHEAMLLAIRKRQVSTTEIFDGHWLKAMCDVGHLGQEKIDKSMKKIHDELQQRLRMMLEKKSKVATSS